MLLRGLLVLGEIPTTLLGADGSEGDDGGGSGDGDGGGGDGGDGDGTALVEACQGLLGVEGLASLVATTRGESHPTAAAASRARDACVRLAYGRIVREVRYLLGPP